MNATAKTPTVLCVLDGLGLNPNPEGNAVAAANTPTLDRLLQERPNATLITHGERVGLPAGQMGNSEVGHLNIGAGRVVEQWLMRISRELQKGGLRKSEAFCSFTARVAQAPAIHLVGLYSDGGVHSHRNHLHDLIAELISAYPGQIVVHLITDGRDTSPHAALDQIRELEQLIEPQKQVCIGSISGRFYAMDRDSRWDRTERAYRTFVDRTGHSAGSASAYLAECYEQGTTDEFIEPAVIGSALWADEDAVIFWNFRADRMRQIVPAITDSSFDQFDRTVTPTGPDRSLCFTRYDENFPFPVLFAPFHISAHLGEVIASEGLTQLRTAETEKYPHVTYFLNGGAEAECSGETRKLVPSPRDVKTYDLKPEMSAAGVSEIVLEGIRSGEYDLIVVNFANCDMVGHTGVLEAAVRAVETVDLCLGKIIDSLVDVGGQAVIIADHGNAEQMVNYENGSPHTAHTTFPVPIILLGGPSNARLRDEGSLCDVAPTILEIMGISQPEQMSGASLIIC